MVLKSKPEVIFKVIELIFKRKKKEKKSQININGNNNKVIFKK